MKSILKVLLLACFSFVQAHTIWIETENKSKINQKHEIKIFFGELSKPTPTKRWFSDLRELELKIISPSGKEQIIKEKDQKENYFSSYFTPTEKGIYTISIKHIVKDVYKDMKITYQSVTFVKTTNTHSELNLGASPVELKLDTKTPKLNENKTIKALSNGSTKEKEKIKIASETGWEKDYHTDHLGNITFQPLIKGKYLIEFAQPKKEDGEHNGKTYKTNYEMITYLIHIK